MQNEFHIGYLQPCQRKRPSAGHVRAAAQPVIAPAVAGACMCVCAWCSKALHLPLRVQGVVAAPRVHQCSHSDVQGVRLRDHDADVLVYDISVSTCCETFRASVALSLGAVWALAPGLERRGVCIPFLDAGGRARPISHVPWDAVVTRSWTTHHARNLGQAARVIAL